MNKTILVRGARQLLTLRGPSGPRRGAALQDLGSIEDGALLIRDGIVIEVGSSRRIENLAAARDAMEIDATGRVVMPGFVDSHTHLVCGPPRLEDYELRIGGKDGHEAADAGGGILLGVKAVRATCSRILALRARRLLDHFVRHGTTTLEAKSGYGLDKGGELKILRVLSALNGKPLDLVSTYFGARAVPVEFEGRQEDYIDWMRTEMLPGIWRRRLAHFVDAGCGRDAFRLHEARRHLEAAREMGFGLKIHADQFHHSGAVRMAVELGAASADHLEHADRDDIAILAQSSTVATLLPASVFHAGLDRYPPARQLIDLGAAVALATGFDHAGSPTCSMPAVLSLACARMRMSPAEVISAATINGAHALNWADRAGSLEPGKQADLIVLDASDYREIPYHFGVNPIVTTMKKGAVLYRRGEVQCPED